MAAVSNARRPAWLAVAVLLAGVLTALGVSVASYGTTESQTSGAAVDNSLVTATAPDRALGRPAVEPSPSWTYGHGELALFGAVPNGVPSAVLPLLGSNDDVAASALPAPHRLPVGDRAPPLRLSDQ
jgi:hypothetical protein